jgi:hypothetical protein
MMCLVVSPAMNEFFISVSAVIDTFIYSDAYILMA